MITHEQLFEKTTIKGVTLNNKFCPIRDLRRYVQRGRTKLIVSTVRRHFRGKIIETH
jgi:hypothetical protein